MQMLRYYGWYSNKMRGQRAKRAESAKPGTAAIEIDDEDTPYRTRAKRESPSGAKRNEGSEAAERMSGKLCRMRWAALIQRVYEVDPLHCPKCGGTMKIIAFIEKRDQADVIEKILRHCGLWERPSSRAPPDETEPEQGTLDLEYIPFEDLAIAQ